jgi:hypothetical protein
MRLAIYDEAWVLNVETCPCDVELVEALDVMAIRGKTLFHFGTGVHHVVGRSLCNPSSRNTVLAVTACPGEYVAYMDLVSADAATAELYKVIFCDIFTLSSNILPMFDLVTLFHLCEDYNSVRYAYAPLNDASLLELMIGQTVPNGRLAFYSGSISFKDAYPLIEQAESRGLIRRAEEYKHLIFYTKV